MCVWVSNPLALRQQVGPKRVESRTGSKKLVSAANQAKHSPELNCTHKHTGTQQAHNRTYTRHTHTHGTLLLSSQRRATFVHNGICNSQLTPGTQLGWRSRLEFVVLGLRLGLGHVMFSSSIPQNMAMNPSETPT